MKLHQIPRSPLSLFTMKKELYPRRRPQNNSQGISTLQHFDKIFLSGLLDRRWVMDRPDTKIHQVTFSGPLLQNGEGRSFLNDTMPCLGDAINKRQDPSFYVVRDDLLHPLVNGNKARKLDGLLPLVENHFVTDVVTCGGCQSAHTSAVAVSCAERGLRSHLLLRGEQPDIPTGYNLITTMYGKVTYVPRSLYAKREEMLSNHANLVAGNDGSVIGFADILNQSFADKKANEGDYVPFNANRKYPKKVVIINEGAGDFAGLLGIIRLVKYMSQSHVFGKEQPFKIVIDSGTGTTAVGLALGVACFGLPWEVTGVMLADTIEGYKNHEYRLMSDFKRFCGSQKDYNTLNEDREGKVHWVERVKPRKFGKVLKGEIESCQEVARQTGILLDPIYTLAAWEQARVLSENADRGDAKVVMLHTGGTLGMFGLAQRYKSFFHDLKD